MERKVINEKKLRPINGFVMLFVSILCLIAAIALFVISVAWPGYDWCVIAGAVLLIVACFLMIGLRVIKPNEAMVLTLFGKYHGTVVDNGFFFINPFATAMQPVNAALRTKKESKSEDGDDAVSLNISGLFKKTISLKIQTLDNGKQKVNDVLGNPIFIGAAVIWRVDDPTRAVFAVENYREFLSIQTDTTIRNISRLYPYDVFDEDEGDGKQEKTLRGSSLEIAESMKTELQSRVLEAGIVIEDVRITHLAYSEEIAAAMLQRQQAVAIIAARQKIVDGAVGMVKMAVEKLNDGEVVHLDEDRKAAMVSNLLVVLCGNKDAQPVVNSSSL